MKQRDPFFDNAKFILMVFVILGHILDIGSKTKTNIVAFEWIFSFHMPLFVFISGYFTKITNTNKYWKGILYFAETLIVFHVIHVIISHIQGKLINIHELLIMPKWTLWYLLSLIWWRLILYYTPSSIRDNHKVLIIISIVLCLIMGWIPINSFYSFQRTFAFFPFFIVGFVTGNKNINVKVKGRKIFSLLFLVSIAIIFYFIPKIDYAILTQRYCYFQRSLFSPFYYFMFRVVWLVFASCMSYCFLSIIPLKKYFWTHWGQLTLFIYMYHSVILLWRFVLRDYFHLPTNLFFCFLYSIIVLGIILIINKVKFFHWLLNPISSTIKIYKS